MFSRGIEKDQWHEMVDMKIYDQNLEYYENRKKLSNSFSVRKATFSVFKNFFVRATIKAPLKTI